MFDSFLENAFNPEFYRGIFHTYWYAFTLFFGILIVVRILETVMLKKLEAFSKKTTTDVDDFLIQLFRKTGDLLYFAIALYFAAEAVPEMNETVMDTITYFAIGVVTYYGLKLSSGLVDYATMKYAKKTKKENLTSLKAFTFFLKFVAWSFILVLVLSNLGYDLTSIIAGLGIGGIAVGLALQNVLADFFSGIIIMFDKPFEIGDTVEVDGLGGTVKSIGVKTTRITLFDGEELVITNKDLTESRIHNFKKLRKRRVVFTLGVTYDTNQSKLKKIPDLVKKIFKGKENVELARVHFTNLGASSQDFEVVYHVLSQDFEVYRNAHQEILYEIVKVFAKEKIEFAFPSQTIYVEKA